VRKECSRHSEGSLRSSATSARSRGLPSACAPTNRYSTPASDNADNISTKSRFIRQLASERPCLKRQLPDHRDALIRCQVTDVVIVGLAKTLLACRISGSVQSCASS